MEQGFLTPEIDRSTGKPTGRMVNMHFSEQGAGGHAGRDGSGRTTKPAPRGGDAGFFVEAYSQDRSNREDSRRVVLTESASTTRRGTAMIAQERECLQCAECREDGALFVGKFCSRIRVE